MNRIAMPLAPPSREAIRASFWTVIEQIDNALEALIDAAEEMELIEGPWAFSAGTVYGQLIGSVHSLRALRADVWRGAEAGAQRDAGCNGA